MSMSKLSDIGVNLSLNSKQFTAGLMAAGKGLDDVSKKSKNLSNTLGNMTKQLAKVGVAGASFMLFATGGFLISSSKTFIAFEEKLVKINAIMGDLGTNAPILEKKIRDVAKASRFTATETAQAAQVLALAGLSFEELVGDIGDDSSGAIGALSMFAEAAGGDIEMAAGIGIAGVKAFGLEIEDMTRVFNVMTTVFTGSFTDVMSLGQAMKFLGPTANAAGVSIEEAASAVGALGNAGIQGTMAGTGLRMAINKILAPSSEARVTMERLGLNIVTMSEAGMRAKQTFFSLQGGIEGLQQEVDATTNSMRILNDEMTDMSIDEQRNSLAVASIRRKASKENRDLTNREIQQINKLESANADLALAQQEGALEQAILTREQDRASRSLEEMKTASQSANDVMNQQVMGITSLSDVVNQLAASGATTTEILDIFSVRGGTAVQALMAQRDGFLELVEASDNSAGALTDHLEILEGSTARRLAIVRSQFEETKLVIGEAFLDALDVDDLAKALDKISLAIAENADEFASFGRELNGSLIPALETFADNMDTIAGLVEDLSPLLNLFIGLGQIILGVTVAVSKLIAGIQELFRLLGKKVGADENVSSAVGAGVSGAAMGAGVGLRFGGVGALVGGTVGGLAGVVGETGIPFLAEGGVVTKPTLAVVGEAGPEAVVPLDRYNGGDSAGTSINFSNVTIYGNPQMGVNDFKRMMEDTLPKVLSNVGKGGVVY